jgi:hypothetical protein
MKMNANGVPKLVLAMLVSLIFSARPSYAQRGSAPFSQSRMVFESCVGPRINQAEAVMKQLRKVLLTETTSYIWDDAAMALTLDRYFATRGQIDPTYSGLDFAAEVRLASKAWYNGDFELARRQFETALEKASENPAAIAQDEKARRAMKSALIFSAIANQRIALAARTTRLKNDATARRDGLMSEYIRSFKDPIRQGEYGSEAVQLYQNTLNLMSTAMVPGTLVITVASAPGKLLQSVNEVPTDETELTLWPGEYRLLYRDSLGASFQFKVQISSGERKVVVINYGVAAAVETVLWKGFRYNSELEQQGEQLIISALRIDGSLLGEAVVFSLTEERGKLRLSATLYGKSGKLAQRGQVELEGAQAPSNPERLQRLLRFLDGNEVVVVSTMDRADIKPEAPTTTNAGVTPITPANIAPQAVANESPSRTLPALTMIAGGAAIITGGVLIKIDEGDGAVPAGQEQPKYYTNTMVPGIITAGAGVAALAVGYLWWRLDAPQHQAARVVPTAALSPGGAGAMFGLMGAF